MLVSKRDAFLNRLYEYAKQDKNIVLLSDDFGSPVLDKWKSELPNQFINVGIAEQNLISIASGLALSGKRVYCYAISPFLVMRAYDQIRIDICQMNLPVTLIGVGTGISYGEAGDTHYTLQDIALMRQLPNIEILSPSDSTWADRMVSAIVSSNKPFYVRLDRTSSEMSEISYWSELGYFMPLRYGLDVRIISTGNMVKVAKSVAKILRENNIYSTVNDVFKIKPYSWAECILKDEGNQKIVTIEEQYVDGGLGTILLEKMNELKINIPLKRFGFPLSFIDTYGTREEMLSKVGLDAETIASKIVGMVD